jgi:predicted DNA-binding protein (MmcQ/YjbR family)
MDLAQFREYCLSKPSATEGTPFGPDVLVFKVSGKMFADAELRKMIDYSYDLVAKGLPKPRAKVAARSRRNSTAARRGRR